MNRYQFSALPIASIAALLAAGCTSLPTPPPWQDITAEREERKEETLQHIGDARRQAADIEQASFRHELKDGALPPISGSTQAMTPRPTPVDSTANATRPPLPKGAPPDDALRNAAQRAVALGDLEEAIGLYRELTARQPNDPARHHSLALVAEQLGRHEEASEHYLEAVRLAPRESLYRLCWEAHADRLVSEEPARTVLR